MSVDDMTAGDGYSNGDITSSNSSMTSGKVAGGSKSRTCNTKTSGTTIVRCSGADIQFQVSKQFNRFISLSKLKPILLIDR